MCMNISMKYVSTKRSFLQWRIYANPRCIKDGKNKGRICKRGGSDKGKESMKWLIISSFKETKNLVSFIIILLHHSSYESLIWSWLCAKYLLAQEIMKLILCCSHKKSTELQYRLLPMTEKSNLSASASSHRRRRRYIYIYTVSYPCDTILLYLVIRNKSRSILFTLVTRFITNPMFGQFKWIVCP